ncbi:MAG: hypothetical protein K2P78_14585 [Gemmataceae bacterium]|nr:hypothetical protein [Gemmataceae bacterium]
MPAVDEAFVRFWTAYPRKENKPAAGKAWAKLAPDSELVATIMAAVERQQRRGCLEPKTAADGRSVIPHPATWINGRRWEDHPPPTGPPRPGGFDTPATRMLDNLIEVCEGDHP